MNKRAGIAERKPRNPSRRAARELFRPQAKLRQALTAARIAAGLTQAELAGRAGTTQTTIARLEGGTIVPTVELLCRLSDVLGLRFEIAPGYGLTVHPTERRELTLAALHSRRDEILRAAAEHGARNVRVFGSVARGEADIDSDVDLLVDVVADVDGFAYFGLLEDLRRSLEALIGGEVDVVDSAGLQDMREWVLREAVPL